MDEREAISILEVLHLEEYLDSVTIMKHMKHKNIALKMAIAALEKQIPKTLDYEGDGCDDAGNIIYDTAICPGCNKLFEVDYDDNAKYCPECGQRLKWEE